MSDDVRDEFTRGYPEGHIEVPPVRDLWARGQRRRRHRTAMQAVAAAASIVVLAGVGAVYGLPEAMTSPSPAPQVGSGGAGNDEPEPSPSGAGDEDEGDCSGLDGYALGVCEDLEEHSPIPEPTEAERAEAAQRQQASQELHAEMNQGLLHAPEGWEPAEAPPADLAGLGPRSGEGAWYVGLETGTGLADRAMLEERIGAETVAELCGWLERESDRADEAAGEPVSRHTVAHHLLGTAEVTGGDGLSLVVAAACR